jgi:CheY-like chemotaxis protein/anti-sigma regulatory factor (Ser/Thr protein kinase)
MSHELRTPLSAILGFAQLIESGQPQPTPEQKRSVDQILQAGWYLLDLINEILDLALIESGKLSLSLKPVCLSDIMLECESMIEPQAKKHNISVAFPDFYSTQFTDLFVSADRTRMKQVLINLLSNALKYNKVGGTVSVCCIEKPLGRVRICVQDSGNGLAPEQIEQLFQPFNRLGQHASEEQGTGIGLVMTKRLVALMGGSIEVESTLGVGSTFSIEMNLTAPGVPHAVTSMDLNSNYGLTVGVPAQTSNSLLLYTLLYIEDNSANLMLITDLMVRRPDIRLLTAGDALQGIAIAKSDLPDVILMDINLPGVSGIKALTLLSKDPATAHIPVVALSANAMQRDIEKGLEAGFYKYLTKPLKVVEFMQTMDEALRWARKSKEKENQ